MQVFFLPVGRGIVGPCFTCGGDVMIGGRVPCQVPRWAWQEVKGEAMAVNKVDYTGVTMGPGERQRRHEVGVVVRRCCCSAHTGNEVSTCVGGVVKRL